MAQPTIDPTFYRTAAEAAAAPVEQLAYVVAFDRAAQKNDAMTVVDVNPASDSYGRVVGWTDVPGLGNELHHFGWNACSRALKHEGENMDGPARRRSSSRSPRRPCPQGQAIPARPPCTADPPGSSSPVWVAPRATTTGRA